MHCKTKKMKDNKELLTAIYSHFPDSTNKDETMSFLITDCVETGIDSWNTKWPHTKSTKEYFGDAVWEDVKNGESLEFGDEDEVGTLNLENILKALEHLKKNSPDTYKDLQNGDWDAYTCDEFFQTAVFGELVFG